MQQHVVFLKHQREPALVLNQRLDTYLISRGAATEWVFQDDLLQQTVPTPSDWATFESLWKQHLEASTMDYQLESPNDSPIAQNDSKASDSSQDEGIDASNSDGDEVGEGKIRKTLSWGVVEVTEFSRTVGLASSVPADGAWPLGMDPEPISTEQIVIPLDEVEKAKGNEAKVGNIAKEGRLTCYNSPLIHRDGPRR